MKKLPIGIQTINTVLNEEYLYVDKTDLALQLINSGKYYFFSRPRRFGKSLFVSTLEEIFKGNKDLFKACKIYHSNYVWNQHPVIHFDFSQIPNRTTEKLEIGLQTILNNIAQGFGLSIASTSLQSSLILLIKQLAKKQNPVVVLVDEYDQPIINNLKNLEIAEHNRDLLKDFFGTLKSLDKYIRFTFVTGVSKFSQVSLFSGPNNLRDITMDNTFAHLMGYTEEEVQAYFADHIAAIADSQGVSSLHVFDQVRQWYNGYRFAKTGKAVYNPFSTLNFMETGEIESYWYSSGTPSFLINEIKKHPYSILPLSGAYAAKSTLSDISQFTNINVIALMYQTGYLTIVDYGVEEEAYRLDFPNKEVRQAFFSSLLLDMAHIEPSEVTRSMNRVQQTLKGQDIKAFVEIMNNHFAKIAYQLYDGALEGFYHAVFLTFLERSGIQTQAEVPTNIGRIDLVADLDDTTWIFEFKLDKGALAAFDQIKDRHYKQRYIDQGKNIMIVGLNFSSAKRCITDWKAKLFSSSGIAMHLTKYSQMAKL